MVWGAAWRGGGTRGPSQHALLDLETPGAALGQVTPAAPRSSKQAACPKGAPATPQASTLN